MEFIPILFESFEVTIIIGLLVMTLLMLVQLPMTYLKSLEIENMDVNGRKKNDINLVLLHNFAISDDAYCFSHSIK